MGVGGNETEFRTNLSPLEKNSDRERAEMRSEIFLFLPDNGGESDCRLCILFLSV